MSRGPRGRQVQILLDTDTGVDDAIAILYVLGTPEADLVALTCVAGNVGVEQVCANNLALLALCGRQDVEVAVGSYRPLVAPLRTAVSHGHDGLGYAQLAPSRAGPSHRSAPEVLASAVRRSPGELTVVATGPLTNVALAVLLEPDLPRLLGRLVIMGGAFHHAGNMSPTSEFNIAVDPEAAKIVFDAFAAADAAARPLVCPLDVTETVEMRPADLQRLALAAGSRAPEILDSQDPEGTRSRASNPLVRMLSDALRFHMESYRAGGHGFLSHMHDPLAVALALEPELADRRAATVDVELGGRLSRGTTVGDFRGTWGRPPNAEVALRVDSEAVLERIVARVGRVARAVTASG